MYTNVTPGLHNTFTNSDTFGFFNKLATALPH